MTLLDAVHAVLSCLSSDGKGGLVEPRTYVIDPGGYPATRPPLGVQEGCPFMPTSPISSMNSDRRVNGGRPPAAVLSGCRSWAAAALGAAAAALTSGAHEPRPPELLLAYVDPGSAGFIIVSVLGFLSAVCYTLRNAVGRLTARLRRLLPAAGGRRAAAGSPVDTSADDVPPPS